MYISSNMSCCELSVENVDDLEILWCILRPKQLPRPLSCLIIAVVYCQPNYDTSTTKNCCLSLLPLVIDYYVSTLMLVYYLLIIRRLITRAMSEYMTESEANLVISILCRLIILTNILIFHR